MLRSILHVVLFVSIATAQDLLTVLSQQKDLSTFTGLVKEFPTLVERANGGTFTVIAPNNDAFTTSASFENTNQSDSTAVESLLHYHFLKNIHPSLSFSQGPLFAATLLSNHNYTNVTGGQRVELSTDNNGKPALFSAIKATSRITVPDLLFIGGVVHVVDAVLSIPVTFPATITAAGLNDLVALLEKGGYLSQGASLFDTVNGVSDLTIFAPNNPLYSANYQGFNGKSQEDLNKILAYGMVTGEVLYSPSLQNNSQFVTSEGGPITITNTTSGMYVDSSKLTTTNFLTSNGVLQILDSLLNPNTSDARPPPSANALPVSSMKRKGLSTGATAAIGVVFGLIAMAACIVAGFLFARRRRSRPESDGRQSNRRGSQKLSGVSELDSKPQKPRPVRTSIRELDPYGDRVERIELEAPERPRLPPKSPRHIGFQIQAGVGLTI